MKKRKMNLLVMVAMLLSALSFGQDVFSDYTVQFDKVHLTNYIKTIYDDFNTEFTNSGTYVIVDSGSFSIHDSGGRQLNVNLTNGVINGRYEEYYSNGNRFTSGTYVNGKKEGTWNIYTENGRLWKSYEYKNDQLNGKYNLYHTGNGTIAATGNYVNGALNGLWTEYYSSGARKMTGTYQNGKKNGNFTEWYTSGLKKSSMDYSNDEIKGKVSVYYETGQLFYEAEMNGREGFLKGYHTNGNLGFEGKIDNHARKGKWNYYDELGNLYTAIDYNVTTAEYNYNPNANAILTDYEMTDTEH